MTATDGRVPDYYAMNRDFFRELLEYLGEPSDEPRPRPEGVAGGAGTAEAERPAWVPNGYDDAEVVDVLRSFPTWPDIERLLNGDAYDDVGVDLSELDFRLCCHVAFVVGPDADQVEDILLDSEITYGRPDGKWGSRRGKQTYLRYTINKAIKHLQDGDGFYLGPGNNAGTFRADAATDDVADAADVRTDVESETGPTESTEPSGETLLDANERAAIVTDTWLDDYLAYCALRTDAPAMFHEALGLIVLSAAVGQRGAIEFGQGEHTPMLWTLLVAPSTRYRKTTSLNLARMLIRDLEQLRHKDLLAPSDFTPQRFVAILAERGTEPVVLARDEFTGFYRALNRTEYMAGAKELLCQLYDGTAFSREKMKPKPKKSDPDDDDDSSAEPTWKFQVDQPFLSIAAGTTPSYLLEVADPDDIRGGFLARFALITPPPIQRGDPRRPISQLSDEMTRQRAALAKDLYTIATTVKKLSVSDSALERFNRYLAALEDAALGAPDPELAGAVFERTGWMALHVAQLLAAGSRSERENVGLPHLLRGIAIAEGWRTMSLAFLSRLAPSKFERMAGRVVQLVLQHPSGVTRRDVMRTLHINKKEMNDYEATLRERGEIRVEKRPSTGPGGEQIVYHPPV